MKVKYRKRLLDELIKSSDNPADFIRYVMALQKMSVEDVCRNIDLTTAHFYVVLSQCRHGRSIGLKVCAKIAQGLDIDPKILNRVISDYNMNKYLQTEENGIYEDT